MYELTEKRRNAIVRNASERILKTLDAIPTGYSRVTYLATLVNMLDDIHLLALEFSLNMTQEQEQKS